MRSLFITSIFLVGISTTNAQSIDTVKTTRTATSRCNGQTILKAEKVPARIDTRVLIFGNYSISGYSVLSRKTPSSNELNSLIGTAVNIETESITGTLIDTLVFTIFEIERLRRDDFIYRVFGREIKAPEPDLPESFNVHKTNNSNCYGIVEIGDGRLAIPYKGVLLYLTRK